MTDELLEGLVDTLGRAERGGTAGEDLREIATRYLQKARREGYLLGRIHEGGLAHTDAIAQARLEKTRENFPIIRKETRPREVQDPHCLAISWTVVNGDICSSGGRSTMTNYLLPTAQRVALWADLLANPTHEVEVEE